MLSKGTEYEVRCPRCDVTFPVETRSCIHCGGKTSSAGEVGGAIPVFEFGSEIDDTMFGRSDDSSRPDSIRPPSPREMPLEDQDADQEAPSVARSILGSMGSLIWIALLIAFSLSGRLCGE